MYPIFYPTKTYRNSDLIDIHDQRDACYNVRDARDVVLASKLGISISDAQRITDDEWCARNPEQMARLLNIGYKGE